MFWFFMCLFLDGVSVNNCLGEWDWSYVLWVKIGFMWELVFSVYYLGNEDFI